MSLELERILKSHKLQLLGHDVKKTKGPLAVDTNNKETPTQPALPVNDCQCQCDQILHVTTGPPSDQTPLLTVDY